MIFLFTGESRLLSGVMQCCPKGERNRIFDEFKKKKLKNIKRWWFTGSRHQGWAHPTELQESVEQHGHHTTRGLSPEVMSPAHP